MKAKNFFNLASFQATDAQRQTAMWVGGVGFVLSLLTVPYASTPLHEYPAFIAIYVSFILLISLLTSYLLYKHFQTTGHYPLLILSGAYLYIGLIGILHLLTFPNVLAPGLLLGAGTQTALWFWGLWHLGFPVGVLLYLWSLYVSSKQAMKKENRFGPRIIYGAIVCVVFLLFFVTTKLHELLPVIIVNGEYTRSMRLIVGPAVLLLHCTTLFLLLYTQKMRTILHVSLTLSIFISLLDVVLTLAGEGRYTVGWYTARINTVLALSIVSITFVYELNKLSDILAEQHQRLQSLFYHNPDAVYSLDVNGTITSTNQMNEKLVGYSRDEVVGESIFTFVLPDDQEKAKDIFQEVLRGQPQNLETTVLHRNGSKIDVLATGIPIFVHERVTGIFCVTKDITEKKRSQEKLEEANRMLRELSLRDGLTGLGNRRYLEEYLQQKWEHCLHEQEPLAVILMDIDNFKAYNDQYGHAMGDRCLQSIAEVLQAHVHPSIGLTSRYGGEELCVILPNTNEQQAYHMAEEIRSRVEQLRIPHVRSEYGIVTISLGLTASVPQEEETPLQLMEMADHALYRCKGVGKNCVLSFSSQHTTTARKVKL